MLDLSAAIDVLVPLLSVVAGAAMAYSLLRAFRATKADMLSSSPRIRGQWVAKRILKASRAVEIATSRMSFCQETQIIDAVEESLTQHPKLKVRILTGPSVIATGDKTNLLLDLALQKKYEGRIEIRWLKEESHEGVHYGLFDNNVAYYRFRNPGMLNDWLSVGVEQNQALVGYLRRAFDSAWRQALTVKASMGDCPKVEDAGPPVEESPSDLSGLLPPKLKQYKPLFYIYMAVCVVIFSVTAYVIPWPSAWKTANTLSILIPALFALVGLAMVFLNATADLTDKLVERDRLRPSG